MTKPCLLYVGLFALLAGCSNAPSEPTEITLATTTSTQDSGLLDAILPAFEQESGIKVKVVAVGSGQALELGRRGDADVLLTHSPEAEEAFMNEGWGDQRLAVMHNDFVLVGPAQDDAKVKSSQSIDDAFKRIAEASSTFVSRGDDSGTHQKEESVWKKASVRPEGDWYLSAGAGMAQSLRIANEKHAYILCDRASYLTLQKELDLTVLFEGDEQLLNRYSVITVSPTKHPHVRHQEAGRLAQFLVSPGGQRAIAEFGVVQFGRQVFVPDGGTSH